MVSSPSSPAYGNTTGVDCRCTGVHTVAVSGNTVTDCGMGVFTYATSAGH